MLWMNLGILRPEKQTSHKKTDSAWSYLYEVPKNKFIGTEVENRKGRQDESGVSTLCGVLAWDPVMVLMMVAHCEIP